MKYQHKHLEHADRFQTIKIWDSLSISFPRNLYSLILDSAKKRSSVCSWHSPLLQNRHRLKHLLNCVQCFVEEKVMSHDYSSLPKQSFQLSVFLLSFILGEWKQTHKDIPCLQSWLCHQLNVWPFAYHFAKSYWWLS